jgi:GntR family transcriptional regulator of arabinose operon
MSRPTLYDNFVNDIEKQVRSNELADGEMLATEKEFSHRYSLSRSTIRKGLSLLEEKRIISRRSGVGRFVSTGDARQRPKKKLIIATDCLDSSFYYNEIGIHLNRVSSRENAQLLLTNAEAMLNLTVADVDGAIITKSTFENINDFAVLPAKGVPCVMFNRSPSDEKLFYVAVDYYYESFRAVELLINSGHKKIACFDYRDANDALGIRSKAWGDALLKHNMHPADNLKIRLSANNFVDEVEYFLSTTIADAVFLTSGNDLAFFINMCGKFAVKIPERFSVISFDNVEAVNQKLPVKISYIEMPIKDMAEQAVRAIVNFSNNRGAVIDCRKQYRAELVITESIKERN